MHKDHFNFQSAEEIIFGEILLRFDNINLLNYSNTK